MERRQLTRGVWWTCAAVVSAQLAVLPVSYVLAAMGIGLFALSTAGGRLGLALGIPALAMGLGAVWFVEYGAGLGAAWAVRHYRAGMRDLPVRRVARWATVGFVCGIILLQILDQWEIGLRRLGVGDLVQVILRAAAVVAGPLVGSRLGIGAWARSVSGRGRA